MDAVQAAREFEAAAYDELLRVAKGLEALSIETEPRQGRLGFDGIRRQDPGLEPWRLYLRQYNTWIRALRHREALELEQAERVVISLEAERYGDLEEILDEAAG